MPQFYRILEICFYSLINFLPYLVLAFIPFRHHLRFSKPITFTLAAFISILKMGIETLMFFLIDERSILSLISIGIYAIFYLIAIKVHFGKLLFTLLILSNFANLVIILSKSIEGIVFGQTIAHESYRYTYSICMITVHLLITLPLYFYFRSNYKKGINKDINNRAFRYLWLIPATFYLNWFHHIYADGLSTSDIALNSEHAVFLLAINMGAFLIYHTVIEMIQAQDKNIALEDNNHQLAMQNLQYKNLQDRINEARQAKHDIQHHIIVMNQYLQNNEYDKLKAYLSEYTKTLPDDSNILFCQHNATNALLLYFAQQAKNQKIDFDVVVADIPHDINLPEHALTVVLGNLLKNALEACAEITDRLPTITIKAKTSQNCIFFHIENTYNGQLIQDTRGYYLSTKHPGRGIGLASIRNIVAHYDGIIEIDHQNGIFSVSVFLNIPPK